MFFEAIALHVLVIVSKAVVKAAETYSETIQLAVSTSLDT
jgi:hypothetical protein